MIMKDSHRDKAHTAPKGGGMPNFQREHWQNNISDSETAGGRYASEMNTNAEYKHNVDKLAGYVKSHRAQH
jgi:hypothetical protein